MKKQKRSPSRAFIPEHGKMQIREQPSRKDITKFCSSDCFKKFLLERKCCFCRIYEIMILFYAATKLSFTACFAELSCA